MTTRRPFAIAIPALAVVLLLSACAPDEVPVAVPEADSSLVGAYRFDAARSGNTLGMVGDSPSLAYRIDGTEPVIASPVLVGDTGFLPNGSGELIAFDLFSGEVRWRSAVGDTEASVVASEDSVFSLSSAGVVRRHDIATGAIVWEADLDGFARSSPLLFDGELWVAVGEELVGLEPSSGVRIGSAALSGTTDSSPAAAAGVIVLGTRSNTLEIVDRASLSVVSISLPDGDGSLRTYADGVAATPAISEGSVLVGSTEGVLVSVALSGEVEWTADLGSPIYGAVALGDGIGYVPTGSGDLIAFALDSGEMLWITELGDAAYSSPVLVGEIVLVTAENGRLFAVAADSGTELWNIGIGETGNYMASTPAVVDSLIVVGSNDGSIVGVSTDR